MRKFGVIGIYRMMMKVFVTGGSGYIGSVVVKRLVERGYDVAVFDDLARGIVVKETQK